MRTGILSLTITLLLSATTSHSQESLWLALIKKSADAVYHEKQYEEDIGISKKQEDIRQATMILGGGDPRQTEGERGIVTARHALQVAEKTFGKSDIRTGISLDILGAFHAAQNDYGEAESAFKRALEIEEKDKEKESLVFAARTLNNLGNLYNSRGNYEEAESAFKRALKIEESFPDLHHSSMGILMNLGDLWKRQEKYEQAGSAYKRAIEVSGKTASVDSALPLYEEIYGKDILPIDQVLAGWGEVQMILGNYTEAEQSLKQALDAGTQSSFSRSVESSEVLRNLADVYKAQAKYAESARVYSDVLAILEEEREGGDISEFTKNEGIEETARKLVDVLIVLGATDTVSLNRARAIFPPILEERRRIFGSESVLVASILLDQAVIEEEAGNDQKAEALFGDALEMIENQKNEVDDPFRHIVLLKANALAERPSHWQNKEHVMTVFGTVEVAMLQHTNASARGEGYDRVESRYREALRMIERNDPDDETLLRAFALYRMRKLYQEQGDEKKAAAIGGKIDSSAPISLAMRTGNVIYDNLLKDYSKHLKNR